MSKNKMDIPTTLKRLSPEELMKPRYKVIADWPGNTKYETGDILKGSYPGGGGGELILNDTGARVWLSPEKYPTNFKRLEWWEERKESDMPEYTKYVNGNTLGTLYCKVEKYELRNSGDMVAYTKDHSLGYYVLSDIDFPATKEEYENQK